MTREEAIYFANCLKNNYTVDLNDMEAFCDEVIKALEQESTPKNDLTEQCIACKYDEIEDENEEHCKKCLGGDSQFELDEALAKPSTKNDLGVDCISRESVRQKVRNK